jgi:hypothetical protein
VKEVRDMGESMGHKGVGDCRKEGMKIWRKI